ncbi:MAG: cysteine--tRNA ligase [Fusobacteriaceae bacterium]
MIKLYNTMSGKIEEFKPLKSGEVSMYVCGPTVYNYIHIGNARPAILFDTIRRYFEYSGYKVTYVQNFTDVDDKIIKRANEEGIPWEEITKKYIEAYFVDTQKINLKEEGMIRPRATEYINEMIDIIKKLIEKNFAYEINGDVYFDVGKYKSDYGKLSNQNTEELLAGARVDVNEIKNSPLDFALWKSAKPDEPFWESPWGKGRPGWHIECSAMSNKLLGKTFDIHGGGQDLIFPHHENEIAQSKCSSDGEFARYWIHNAFINVKGEKMSKSLNNFFLLRDVLEKYSGNILRFFMISSHYRKPINFSEDEMIQAKSGLERIMTTVERVKTFLSTNFLNNKEYEENNGQNNEKKNKLSKISKKLEASLKKSKQKFREGMDEDFNTAIGIGAVFELVRDVNVFLDSVENVEKDDFTLWDLILKGALDFIKISMEDVLGVKLEKQVELKISPEEIEAKLKARREARANKDWTTSDKIREELAEHGVKIKDSRSSDGKDITTWGV